MRCKPGGFSILSGDNEPDINSTPAAPGMSMKLSCVQAGSSEPHPAAGAGREVMGKGEESRIPLSYPGSMPPLSAELIIAGPLLLLLPRPLGLAITDLLTPTRSPEVAPKFFAVLAPVS